MTLKQRLCHNVTGAIERGESEAIAGIPLPTIGEKLQSIQQDKQAKADFIAKCNPSLVCSAPDLLDILRAAVARIEIANSEGDQILSAWLQDARNAIYKAEGNQ